ncbi:MAG: MMPL family transporter [Chitinophagaceae bacterium]|nr:MMPL family transporter [Chitinophagaceae bacterium]
MWRKLGQFIVKHRLPLLILLAILTAGMGYLANKVELSYEFARAIPTDNPKYKAYQEFRKKFGEDGNLLVIGFQTDSLSNASFWNDFTSTSKTVRRIPGVEDILSVATAVNLVKSTEDERLLSIPLFRDTLLSQQEIDSSFTLLGTLPFYKGFLYNAESRSWLMGIRINKQVLASKKREKVVNDITRIMSDFGKRHQIEIHQSGLPHIRTILAVRIANEMKWFLIASFVLSALILLLFFRSLSAMWLSLSVVVIGVIWSLGVMQLFGYKISLLTALIPPLVVVIGIPNCIYFLNKFHTSYNETGDKKQALVLMVEKMGIVTLFCNLTAAIGFAVFALTKSEVLREFGVVAGINIMLLFFISLILIPAVLSYLPSPKSRHTKYLDNPRLNRWLDRLERWSLNHRKLIYIYSTLIVIVSVAGMFRLKSEGFIVDDIPKTDKIYTDLKFFETNFRGIMPLEIILDTRQKNGLRRNALQTFKNIDSLSQFIAARPEMARPLSIVEGMKFAKQAFFDGDSAYYSVPDEYVMPALNQYFSVRPSENGGTANSFSRIVASFMDSTRQEARISVNMADVGSHRLPEILDSIQQRANQLFDTSKYSVRLTGTSVTFQEGNRFIINGLKESIGWAFALIAVCMLYLFRSVRILACSLIPNIIPLVITAGVMGWVGIRLKPSTVLIFSVALGIAIDVTIRFLINFKQELPRQQYNMQQTVIETIHSTGISIIYTSLVLIAGFVIFCFSGFGGTQSLGWLTSLTLVTATITNLVLLPAVLISLVRFRKK